MTRGLHLQPATNASASFLYVESARVEQDAFAVMLVNELGSTPVPVKTLCALVLGPGTSVTHAAMKTLAQSGCSVVWTGADMVRFYASGAGETRLSRNLQMQAEAWASGATRLEVAKRMYRVRFEEAVDSSLTIEQLRGMEGVRVRDTYARLSAETGVPWSGRSFAAGNWSEMDPVNRALSAANACLYGVCHAGIVASGFATGLGFIHSRNMLAFVYDVADLYKTETTIPAAFVAAADGGEDIERRVRSAVRRSFVESAMLDRIVPDMLALFGAQSEKEEYVEVYEEDPS